MAQPALTAQTPSEPHSETVPEAASSDEESLHQMFPDLDTNAIHDCYVLCERNLERTIEFLLGDANAPVTTGNQPEAMDMDEQLARQLEQEELVAYSQPRQQNPPLMAPPAVTNTRAPPGPPSNEPSIQEQAMKFVETGKRTFNSIFEKVKEKLKEFDEPAPGSSSHQQQQAPNVPPSQQYYYAPSSSTSATTPPAPAAGQVGYVGSSSYAPTPQPAPRASTFDRLPPATSGHPAPAPAPAPVAAAPSSPPAQPYSITEGAKPGPAFLDKRPTALVETPRPHPEEDLTENPFDDRNH